MELLELSISNCFCKKNVSLSMKSLHRCSFVTNQNDEVGGGDVWVWGGGENVIGDQGFARNNKSGNIKTQFLRLIH